MSDQHCSVQLSARVLAAKISTSHASVGWQRTYTLLQLISQTSEFNQLVDKNSSGYILLDLSIRSNEWALACLSCRFTERDWFWQIRTYSLWWRSVVPLEVCRPCLPLLTGPRHYGGTGPAGTALDGHSVLCGACSGAGRVQTWWWAYS